jgi:Ham1 family protein
MKKILIATRNKDKYKIVSKLLSAKTFKNFKFISLNEIKEDIIDKKEVGDIENRSYEKAINVYKSLKNNIYDYIIGIDDGIEIRGNIIENVKEYIKAILDNKYLKENEKVYIVRAYTFINKKGKFKIIFTKIPFKYKKLEKQIKIEENSYPLSHVLTPIDSNQRIIDLDEYDTNKYYLNYSEDKFNEVEKYFEKEE